MCHDGGAATQPLAEADRAVLDGEDAGFARVHVRKGTDRILGATGVLPQTPAGRRETAGALRAGSNRGVAAVQIPGAVDWPACGPMG